MNRPMFQLTEQQMKKCQNVQMPSDDTFKAQAKKTHKPWGIVKRDLIVSEMKKTPEYQRGLWQGRIDRANGLDYSEERIDSVYNLGYYNGYLSLPRDLRGGVVIPAEYLIHGEIRITETQES